MADTIDRAGTDGQFGLAIRLDRTGDIVKVIPDSNSTKPPIGESIKLELDRLNGLYAVTIREELGADSVPPKPTGAVPPARAAKVNRQRETGNQFFKESRYAAAIRSYDSAIATANERPPWEVSGIRKAELARLYANRAQANIELQNWPEALADSRCSVGLQREDNVRAWWRVGRCLAEMGRLVEAKQELDEGVAIYPDEKQLMELSAKVTEALEGGFVFRLTRE